MKKFYVTKKQVNKYIANRLKYFNTVEDFYIAIDGLLDYLDYKPEVEELLSIEGNEAQIKFYSRVKARLVYLIEEESSAKNKQC